MRLFIGIDLPDVVKDRLLALQADLKQAGVQGSWKLRDNFHLTLEFLGELEPQAVLPLGTLMEETAGNQRPFRLQVAGLGAFPSFKRPHTLWAGVQGDLPALHKLQADLRKALQAQGFAVENRGYKPHLTLASRPSLNGVDLSRFSERSCGEFAVKEIILFESSVIKGRRVYTDLFRAALGRV